VIRVQEQVLVEQAALPFPSFYQSAPEIEIDNEVVLQTGSYGLNASRVRVRLENGVETGRTIEGEWVVREPEPRIIGYGTNIIIRTLNTPDGPIEYWRAVEMFATSYSPCRLGPGSTRCSYIARSGLPVQQGLVAFLPEWYDYMALTQVYVPGYGIGTVGDTGWGLRGRHWIDLAYGEDDWISWASNVTVYFLTPVPSEIMWILYVRD
jgi:3D (Asp-Asp-Asp) domain-containing protein